MDIATLIQLLTNRMNALNNAKVQAVSAGDVLQVNNIDADIMSTQNSLQQLKMLTDIISAAAATNSTATQMIASGALAMQNAANVPENPTIVLDLYNLSTYASDPLYLQKITDILSVMPTLDTAEAIDAYINSEAIGSPLTGQMILAAAQQYIVDTRMLVAILELESNFGTAGVAVSTLNPGNVGNTGSGTRTYSTWADGVAAVAKWLSLHPSAGVAAQSQSATPAIPVVTTPPIIPMDPSAFVQTTTVVVPPTDSATTTPPVIPTVDQIPAPTTTPDTILPATNPATSTPATVDSPPVATSTPASVPDITPTITPDTITPTDPVPTATSSPISMRGRKKKRSVA